MTSLLTKPESERLSAQLRELKRRNPLTQMPDHYRVIVPDWPFLRLADSGRKKYSAIVYVVHLSLRWKGWQAKKRRGPVEPGVMLTKRFMEEHYGYSHSTIETAIGTLVSQGLLKQDAHAVYSGGDGRNKGNIYSLSWLPTKGNKRNAWLFWGVFTSAAFLGLDITTQAIFILLHFKLNRKANRLVCRPGDLTEFGVSRKIVTRHLDKLRHAGLLEHVDAHVYRFPWLISPKKIDVSQLPK